MRKKVIEYEHEFLELLSKIRMEILMQEYNPSFKRGVEIRALCDELCKAKIDFKKYMYYKDKKHKRKNDFT